MLPAASNHTRIASDFPEISATRWSQLQQYVQLVEEWNRRVNLVSRKDVTHLWEHHVVPSLAVLKVVNWPHGYWVMDIGSGGGFPAIPLKIACPQVSFLLVESVRKKALFLRHVIHTLKLDNIALMENRVEAIAEVPDLQEKFHVVTARAVAGIRQLIEWGWPFLKSEGYWLMWKSEKEINELQEVAGEYRLKYQILAPPETLQKKYPRLASQRWFQVFKPSEALGPEGEPRARHVSSQSAS